MSTPLLTVRGIGRAFGHHGELLQGAFRTEHGARALALVTLPFARAGSRVTCALHEAQRSRVRCRHGELLVERCREHRKALRAACLTMPLVTDRTFSAVLTVETTCAAGHGFGSSTSDVVATIRAVMRALRARLPSDEVARIAVAAEKASDPVMFPAGAPLLFAQREGRVMERFPGALPRMVVVGAADPSAPPVRTPLNGMPAYTGEEMRRFDELRRLFRKALVEHDASLLAQIATASARINQRIRPIGHFEAYWALARRHGALGAQVAHSGTICGAIFDASAQGMQHSAELLRAARSQGLVTHRFSVGKLEPEHL